MLHNFYALQYDVYSQFVLHPNLMINYIFQTQVVCCSIIWLVTFEEDLLYFFILLYFKLLMVFWFTTFSILSLYFASYMFQAHAASAVLNFSENCTPDILTPYLDGIVSKLLVLLQVCNVPVHLFCFIEYTQICLHH